MKEYVVGFAFNPAETHVALIRKTRPSWQAGRLNGIGGKLERNEHSRAAMRREFREEAGLDVKDWTLFATLEGGNDEVRIDDPEPFKVWFFRTNLADDAQLASPTDEKVVWASTDYLPLEVLPNLHWLIPMARGAEAHDWPFRVVERAA